jgi:hypothetical protein
VTVNIDKLAVPQGTTRGCWTFGGVQSYHHEIAILSLNGYEHSEHYVPNRDGQQMVIGALHRGGRLVKVYEL